MHFSTVALSMLAGSAMAEWSWGNYKHHVNYEVVTEVKVVTITAGAEAVQPQPAAPTTFVKKVSTKKVAAAPAATTTAAAVSSGNENASSGSSNLDSDKQAALDAHNSARSDVGNSALEWDDSLAADAQTWADHLLSVGSLTHSDGSGQGENLYQGYGENPFKSATDAFISEKSSYNGEAISGSNYMSFGHYTQCVWKSTTKVGMAVAKGSDGKTWVVARYSPPGNMIGEAAY